MKDQYYINHWAKVRRDELVDIPDEIEIHNDFLKILTKEEFEAAFRAIWDMFYQIYDDIAKHPEDFSMPLVRPEDFHYGSSQARQSRKAAWRPIDLIYYMALCGVMDGSQLHVNVSKFNQVNTVKQIHTLLKPLYDYGFAFGGLKNNKIPKYADSFSIEYPDHPNVLLVLHLVAMKVTNVHRNDLSSRFTNDFVAWNYRILKDDFNTIAYGDGVEYVGDKMHTQSEQEFVNGFDKLMEVQGYYCAKDSWNEGPALCYYDKENTMLTRGPYVFRVISWKSKLRMYLRIRNANNCLDYLKQCPESVKEMFLNSDPGCANRFNGCCNKGVAYVLDGKDYWRCGCCQGAFQVAPQTKDIPYYLKLVELGIKK